MDDKKIAIRLFRTQLQEGRIEGEAQASMAKTYIQYLNELSSEELRAQGIPDHYKMVMDVRRVVEKETVHTNALCCLTLASKGVEMFNREWNKLVEAGIPPCWDPKMGTFSELTAYE